MRKIWLLLWLCLAGEIQAEISRPVQDTLANGLRYTLLPLHSEKGHIEIRMKVYAGSVDENDDQAGVAHMVEHLVFRATQKYPNGLMPHLHQQKWVRGKNYNAVTTNDNTTYMLTPPTASGLAQSLDMLSQMLFFAQLSAKDLDDERKIILEEWRAGQGVANRMNRARTNVVRMDSRYTRHPVIGTAQSIQTMPAEQLQKFYQQWYVPNNMQLLIIGDIDIAQSRQLIEHYLGQQPAKPLTERNYLNPTLSEGLRTVQIQDEQSGVSQIAYIFRFNEPILKAQTDEGRYARLIDRLAVAAVTQRLRNQSQTLPPEIRSIVLRKSEIGSTTSALALFAGVAEQAHRQGLQQILTELERLKRFPITQAELDQHKSAIQAQIDRAKQHNEDRDFSGWVQAMVDSVLSDKAYLTQQQIATLTEPMLAKITLNEVNRHIQHWFEQADQIVQYQAPHLTAIEPIEADFVKSLQKQTASSVIEAPQQEKTVEVMSLNALETNGSIIAETPFPEQNVTYFTLSNGDKVVWLKSPLAKEKSYFEARSSAGYQAYAEHIWQSQIASQLIAQNAPLDWTIEQLKSWKERNKVNLSLNQQADELIYTATVDSSRLADLLRLYYAYQQETWVKEGLDDAKERLAKTLQNEQQESTEKQQTTALNRLLFGDEKAIPLPDTHALNQLSDQTINRLWAEMRQVPTTFYLMNNMTGDEVKSLITRYLAGIPRSTPLQVKQKLMSKGRETVRFPMNIEPKDEVKMWFFTEQQWQGKDAVLVSLLRSIVANKLKLSLRDEHLGIYSLNFESTLNPLTHRIESKLSFSANPSKTDELIQLAEKVLSDLPQSISESDVNTAKAQFIKAEQERLKSPHVWLNRLVLSHKQFGSPRYLSEVQTLAENITLPHLQTMAGKLYHKHNLKIFITTPK